MRAPRNSLAMLAAGTMALSWAGIAAAQETTIERPVLKAEQCNPLTDENRDVCCVAENRADILKVTDLND